MRTTPWRRVWLLLGLIEAAVAVKCYYCTSMLNSDVEDDAKTAMKKLVYENYNLPPTHELCSLPDDIEFRIVPHIDCAEDYCVRITAFEDKLHFVMRGCARSVSRIGHINGSCSNLSPSVCNCDDQDLCNFQPPVSYFFDCHFCLSIWCDYLLLRM